VTEDRPQPALTIGICGLGLIGSSVARGLMPHHRILGLDSDPETLAKAAELGVESVAELATFSGCDIIFLCAPTSVNQQTLASLMAWPTPVPVVDIGSVKSPIHDLWLTDPDFPFIGSHPMAGSELSGIESGQPTLFEFATWPVVVHERTNAAALLMVVQLIDELRARAVPVTAKRHDEAVALASHLPHLLAAVLGETVASSGITQLALTLAAGSFRDATRVTASPPDRTAEFLLLNREPLAAVARNAAAKLEALAIDLERGDLAGVTGAFERAQRARYVLDERSSERMASEWTATAIEGNATGLRDIMLSEADTGTEIATIQATDDGHFQGYLARHSILGYVESTP